MVESKQDRAVIVFGITKDKPSQCVQQELNPFDSIGKSVSRTADPHTVVYVPLASLLNRFSLLLALLV